MQPITYTLTALQYSTEHSGGLKLYRFNAYGYHGGGVWLARNIRYPDEEISMNAGKELCQEHMARGLEVRICNGLDELVFHAKGQEVIYPPE